MDPSLTAKTMITKNNSSSPNTLLENLPSKHTLRPVDSFHNTSKINNLSINSNNDALLKPLSNQTKQQTLHNNTNPLLFRQLPQIKTQKIYVQPLNDRLIQERNNNNDKTRNTDKKIIQNKSST